MFKIAEDIDNTVNENDISHNVHEIFITQKYRLFRILISQI